MFDRERIKFKEEITGLVDLGYLGLKAENLEVIIPHKKSKLKKLTKEQKSENKKNAGQRIVVEHAIGGVKRLFILRNKLRVKKDELRDKFILLGCGLYNFMASKRIIRWKV